MKSTWILLTGPTSKWAGKKNGASAKSLEIPKNTCAMAQDYFQGIQSSLPAITSVSPASRWQIEFSRKKVHKPIYLNGTPWYIYVYIYIYVQISLSSVKIDWVVNFFVKIMLFDFLWQNTWDVRCFERATLVEQLQNLFPVDVRLFQEQFVSNFGESCCKPYFSNGCKSVLCGAFWLTLHQMVANDATNTWVQYDGENYLK